MVILKSLPMNTWYDKNEFFLKDRVGLRKSDLKRKRIGKFLLVIVLILSLLNIAGWLLGFSFIEFLQPGGNPMRHFTAICFVLSSTALLILQIPLKKNKQIAFITGLLVMLAGLLNLAGYIFAMLNNTGENQDFPSIGAILSPEHRMAFLSAGLFSITGVILMLLSNGSASINAVHSLVLPVLLISYFVPVGYILGRSSLFAINHTAVSFYAGLNFCLLSVSVLLMYPKSWIMKVFSDEYTGGNMARRLIPGIIIAPLVIGWLRINGEKAGFYNSEVGVILITITYTFCFLILVWFAAKSVIRVDEKKRLLDTSLRRSREQYYMLVDSANSIIIRYGHDGIIKFVNVYGLRFFGYSRDEMIGKSVRMIIPDEESTGRRLSALVDDIISSPLDYIQFENENLKKNGERVWINWTNRAFTDKEGNLKEILAIGTDFTEKKLVMQSLRESEEKFRSLFESIPEGVALHEVVYENGIAVNYRILDVNPAYEKITGISHEAAVRKLATEIYQGMPPPFLKEYAEVAETQKPYRFETYFHGINRYFLIDAISPKKGQFAVVFEDVTEEKQLETEMKQKNEDLTRFIYTVSHDLKSPLVTIKSFAGYLKEDIENRDLAAQEKDIGYINNAADKMAKLLNELLELSRIGRKEDPKTEVPLHEVVREAVDLVAGSISQRKAKVIFTGPPVMIYGFTQRLIQLFQNLIDNAVKFMGNQSEPTIEIGAHADDKDRIIFFVRDNGSGIDKKFQHKVFGLFEKLDNTTEGTGIGLSLIKRIVEVHGGNIWFTSEGVGKGTTFYFTLEGSYMIGSGSVQYNEVLA